MRNLVRVPLEGGGEILFEAAGEAQGPVKVGRVGDVVRELPQTLSSMLTPVRDTTQAVLDLLRQAGPDEVEFEFGLDLSAEAGVVITKTQGAFHMKVRVLWQQDEQSAEAQ
ncbi:CU044_2847 family protein [Streptomyces sp. enrichment culture]|uniref:CU044_2847 family protein n=1 Tax=Streptomyces sp. enrichment culture TaxID=1795815 RepID=UPI003F54B7F2